MVRVISVYRGQPRNYLRIVCLIGRVMAIYNEISFPLKYPDTFSDLLAECGGSMAGEALGKILNRLGL